MRKFTVARGFSKLYQSPPPRNKKKRNRLLALLVLVFLLGVPITFYTFKVAVPAFKRLSIFEFKRVMVKATEHITEAELRKLVGKPSRENIFELDLNRIKEKIRKNPWVLDIKVTRLLPDQLRIDVVERHPVAILSLGKLRFLDGDGKMIAAVRPRDAVDFPIISGVSKKEYETGVRVSLAFDLIRDYQENTVFQYWKLSEVHWNKKNGFVFYTKDPSFEVRLGKTDFDKKFVRLERVLKDLYQKNITPSLIDLNFSKKVVVKHSK